jgi:hydroxymethylglutaryl-CoA lyase
MKSNKELVLYLSMGFGNPYGEDWHPDIVAKWSEKLYKELDVKILALSDTIGVASPEIVDSLFSTLIQELPEVEFGAHLHTIPKNAQNLVKAAYEAGCRRFDGAIKGFGGCPMAKDDLTGNMPTEAILAWFDSNDIKTGIAADAFVSSMQKAVQIFP